MYLEQPVSIPAKQPLVIVLSKPENSLKALAATGANPSQMLWGMVWTQTLPKLFGAIFKAVMELSLAYLAYRYGR